MKPIPTAVNNADTNSAQDDLKKKLKLVRAGQGIASSLAQGNLDKAFARTIVSGIKLASNPFQDPLVNPLVLASALKALGIEALGWKPETLFAAIDRRFNDWTETRVNEALEKFHDTGLIDSDVPSLVRQKIYAIRVVATTDIPHNEWHIFEKIGCAFNDRVAQFGVVERLSAGECARTIAVIESIRPDEYSNEVKVYIAASAHIDGLLTLRPSKYLKMAEYQLEQVNFQDTGTHLQYKIKDKIAEKVEYVKAHLKTMTLVEDIETIQAIRLASIDAMGDEVIQS